MKKLLSLFLVLAVISACGTSALASNIVSEIEFDNRYKVASEIYTANTNFQDIKESAQGQYAMEIETHYGPMLQPVGRLDANMKDSVSFQQILQNNKVPEEVKASIRMEVERATAAGNDDLCISYFSPNLLVDDSVSAYSTNSSEIIEHRDAYMKNERVYYTNISTETQKIVTGPSTAEAINDFVTIALIGASLIESPLVLIGSTAVSIAQYIYSNYEDSVITGSYENFFECSITYDKIEQFTYRSVNNTWFLGLKSQCVTVTIIETNTYFYDDATRTGTKIPTSINPNVSMQSTNYANPWETAYQNYEYYAEETISWKLGTKTLYF